MQLRRDFQPSVVVLVRLWCSGVRSMQKGTWFAQREFHGVRPANGGAFSANPHSLGGGLSMLNPTPIGVSGAVNTLSCVGGGREAGNLGPGPLPLEFEIIVRL